MAQHLDDLPPIVVAETLATTSAIVDVWAYAYDEVTDPSLLAAQEQLMSAEERGRCQRYHFEKDRLQFRATRALVRCVLSEYEAVARQDWRFAAGSHGRPHIVHPSSALSFNLSNTAGMVVCAVSRHREIGIDVEAVERVGETVEIADRFFAPSEVQALRALPLDEQRERFFTYWTLKESYIKARSLGLAIPLDQFAFEVENDLRIAFDPRLVDDAARWQFRSVRISSVHLMAVAADVGAASLVVRVRRYVPLASRY